MLGHLCDEAHQSLLQLNIVQGEWVGLICLLSQCVIVSGPCKASQQERLLLYLAKLNRSAKLPRGDSIHSIRTLDNLEA